MLRRSSKFLPLLCRGYLRLSPFEASKRWLWSRIMDPYLIWRSHPFVASTVFGMRINGNAEELIQQYIYYFGVWEPHITAWISSCLRSGDTFVDVGANIGYYSLLASKLVGPCGGVVAIEASPSIFSQLQTNLKLNHVSNVRALNVAASDQEGELCVFKGHKHNIGLTTLRNDKGFEIEASVPTAPLSKLLRPQEVQTARVIKIDVEGAEASVLSGMESIATSGRSDLEIIVEINAEVLERQCRTAECLLMPLLRAGYHLYEIENDYSPLSYIPVPPAKRPRRIRSAITHTMDIVLSRHDARYL